MKREDSILSKFSLEGRAAIVTGGGGPSIGGGIALGFARAGANVVIAEIDAEKGGAVVKAICALGGKAIFVPTDVTNDAQVKNVVARTLSEFGSIDILVNNVGATRGIRKPYWEMSEDEWDSVISMNLKSTFLCSRAVSRAMIDQRRGSIVNISSGVGERAYPNCAPYGAAKAAVMQFTQTLAVSLAPYNVRANCIAAGPTAMDPPLADSKQEPLKTGLGQSEGFPLAMHRPGMPEDVALTAIYLASDAASYITGATVRVSGGPIFGTRMLELAQEVWNPKRHQ